MLHFNVDPYGQTRGPMTALVIGTFRLPLTIAPAGDGIQTAACLKRVLVMVMKSSRLDQDGGLLVGVFLAGSFDRIWDPSRISSCLNTGPMDMR